MAVAITQAIQNQIAQNYIAILGRNPDPAGFSFWVQTYADANATPAALTAITNGFGNSAEFRGTYAGLTTDAAISLMYQNVLQRAADAPGLAYWSGIANALIAKGETISNAYAQTGAQMIYTAAANGTSDSASIIARTATAVASGSAAPTTTYTLSTVAPETITATGINNVINGTQATLNSNDTIVGSTNGTTRLNLVDTGTAAWSPTAASITNVQTVALRNINGTAAVAAVTAVNEQQTVTVSGTVGNATSVVGFLGVDTASVASGSVASTVAAAIVTAKAAICAGTQGVALGLIDISAAGAVLTLTFNSAKGNVANVFSPASATGGVISFSAGVETVLGVAGVVAVPSTPFTDTVDATKFGGATSFINDVSANQVDFTGLTAAQSVTISGNGSQTNGATTAAWGSTVTAGTLNISGGTVGTGSITTSGTVFATQTVNSIGANNTIGALTLGAAVTALNINATTNLTTGAVTNTGAAALTTITITGAGAVNLSTNALQSTVTTINASGNSGGLTVALGSAVTQRVTGSSANDVITTGSLVLTTGSVDAGGGTGDVLDVSTNVGNVNTAALAAKYTNFEILRVRGTMDASLITGITQVQLSGATNNISNLSAAQTVYARTDIGATTLAPVSGTTNTLNLTMGNTGTTASAANSGALTINGYQTLNVNTIPGATVAFTATGVERTTTIDSFTAANLTAINLTGTAAVLSDVATTLAVTINGSALTGNGATTSTNAQGLTVAGNLVTGSSVIGSELRDQFTLGTAVASTYNGGGGNDLFITSVTNLGTGSATNPVLIGGSGTDTLRISNATVTLTDANFKSVSGFETLNMADATGNISITGLTTNANAAFATGMTVTAGSVGTPMTTAKTFTFEGLAYANNVTLTLITNDAMITNAGNISITTGAGNDAVTVTAASLTGATATTGNGTAVIATGSGVDTITVSTGTLVSNAGGRAVTITAGTGADVINVTSHTNAGAAGNGNIMFTTAAGDSTTTAYDQITGFIMSDVGGAGGLQSDAIDFASVALTAYNATAAAGYTAGQLTVAVSATGVVTLAGTSAAGLTLQQTIDAVQSVVTIGAGDSALFTYAIGGVTSTYVFNNNATADSVVQLVGITGAALLTTNDATTDNGIFIL